MNAWLYLIAAFGSWFASGFIVGALLMGRRPWSHHGPFPESSLGTDRGISTPGAGVPAPGVVPTQ